MCGWIVEVGRRVLRENDGVHVHGVLRGHLTLYRHCSTKDALSYAHKRSLVIYRELSVMSVTYSGFEINNYRHMYISL